MSPPKNVKLGALTHSIVDAAVWRQKDEFPAHQPWADEIERIFEFLQDQDQFSRFQTRLCARERDGAMAEARTGFYFHRKGFRILTWQPVAVPGIPGDIEVAWRDTEPLFLEVKSPRWEGELDRREIQAGRTKSPKFINAEARAVDPVERVMYVVGKALPKFSCDRVNIVTVVDDLFISPLDLPSISLPQLTDKLADAQYGKVSGLFLLNPQLYGEQVRYRTFFIPGKGKPLPEPVGSNFLEEVKVDNI